jgi:hypothetical protein
MNEKNTRRRIRELEGERFLTEEFISKGRTPEPTALTAGSRSRGLSCSTTGQRRADECCEITLMAFLTVEAQQRGQITPDSMYAGRWRDTTACRRPSSWTMRNRSVTVQQTLR